jgi:hypothetical protein
MLGLFLSSLLLASNLSRTFAEHNFVTIPAGSLPFINQKFVPSFEAAEGKRQSGICHLLYKPKSLKAN